MDNRTLFKNSLKLIEIENFSYCNRTCWFCPNSVVDRSENKWLPVTTYDRIIDQLAEIEYSGELTYSRYNEPLAFRTEMINRLKCASIKLPNAVLRTNTNGDYLTADYVEELAEAGLKQLWIQQYPKGEFNHDEMAEKVEKKIEKLGLTANMLVNVPGFKIEYELVHPKMTIHIRARNFAFDGSSRGEVVPVAQDYIRTAPCRQVHNNMYIDFNGKIMVCCALRSDIPKHRSGVMGHVDDGKLWDIFQGEAYRSWREMHSISGPKEGFCKTCRHDLT